MAILKQPLSSEQVTDAMINGLVTRIRDELRERITAAIEPELNSAIDAAVKALDVAIQVHRNDYQMQDIVKVLVEKRGVTGTE